MTIALVQYTAFLNPTGGFLSSCTTPALSAPTTVGNLLLAIIPWDKNTSGAITGPAGFTQAGTQINSTASINLAVFWKIADGTETTFNTTCPSTISSCAITVFEYSGTHATAPIQLIDIKYVSEASVNSIVTGTLGPTTTAETFAIAIAANDSVVGRIDGAKSWSNGFTNTYTSSGSSTGNGGQTGFAMGTQAYSSIQVSISTTFTYTGGADQLVAALIVLAPGSAGPITPTVTTTTATSITPSTATSGGNVTSDGGVTVTARGVCWSASSNPTTADSKTTDGTGAGSFTSSLTGLTNGVTYHYRAYATNLQGTTYGIDKTFLATAYVNTVQILNLFPPARTSVTAKIQLTTASSDVRLRAYRASDDVLIATSSAATLDARMCCAITLTGLTANVDYKFRVVADGVEDTGWTTLNTTEWLQDGSSHTYKIFLSGDCRRPSVYGGNLQTFQTMSAWGCKWFVTVGDFPYCDVTTNDPDAFAAAAEEIQHDAYFKAFSKQHAWTYMFDNHDSNTGYPEGGNASIPAARQEWARYNPLGTLNESNTLSYYYKKGRIYHVVPDLRSNKYHSVPQIMSPTTLQMIKDVITLAAIEGCAVIMHSSTPYCSTTLADDDWSNYTAQRNAIHDHLALNAMKFAFAVVHNDAHMLGFDDGLTNAASKYGTGTAFGVPVWCAAPVHSQASIKGSQTYKIGMTYAAGLLLTITEPATGAITLRGQLVQDNQTFWRDDTITLTPPTPIAGISSTNLTLVGLGIGIGLR